MRKILSVIIGIIFLIGIATAGTITNINPVQLSIPNFVAGGTTSTVFNFDYPNVDGNFNNAPLVAKVQISSVDENFPVGKEEFGLFMFAEQYLLPGFFKYNTIPMTCSENAPIDFKAKDKPEVQYTISEISDGSFYCYNQNYYMLQLDSNDKVTLEITSNPAIYPGEYKVDVELLEMEPDSNPPEIELVSVGSLFSEEENIPVKLKVTDMYNIKKVEYKITNPDLEEYYNSGWIEVQLNEDTGFYEDEFNFAEYELSESGSYWIFARACDVLGNCGEM